MSNYIRFFHLEMHRFTFLDIETLVTLLMLLLFLLLPVKYTAFFPHAGFRRFAQKRFARLPGGPAVVVLWPDCVATDRAVQAPNIHDEFSYLLASDTFAHGRLTNPTPALWHHFEAFYVLLQPTFQSKYGAAQPLFMALGQR